MDAKRRGPIGIELVRRGLISESDIDKALEHQKENPDKKIIDIIHEHNLCDEYALVEALGDILDEKALILNPGDINLNISDYISIDIARQNRAVPFEISGNRIKVCFADTLNKGAVDKVRLILLNKGLIMEKYITFDSNIQSVLDLFGSQQSTTINTSSDVTGIVDSIIKNGIKKRASDIHIEPMEDKIRVRYRIDGELCSEAKLPNDKKEQIIGRLKAISNMYQEKRESQDGRIVLYPDFNIRVSSQMNIYGEKFVLRLLKKNSTIKGFEDLGFFADDESFKKYFDRRNSITVIAAPTGEGKTTTLYSIINYLNKPEINITTIEDPVEVRIPGLNQIEINERLRFSDSLRTVLRQDPDIILVGEIRDTETAEIAINAGQTGHHVLSTIHTLNCIEIITRLRKMGISNYDISSILGTTVSQRLVRRLCTNCAKKREFTEKEIEIIKRVEENTGVKFDLDGKFTYDAVGCNKCNGTGYYERIGVFEVLPIDEKIKEVISKDGSTMEIRKVAMECGFKPIAVDAINKVLNGYTTISEINKKIVL